MACGMVFHRDCLGKEPECPSCKRNIQDEGRKLEADSQAAHDAALDWGRHAVSVICIGMVVLQALALAFAWASDQLDARVGISLVVMIALTSALYSGQSWARLYVALTCTFAAVVCARLAWTSGAIGDVVASGISVGLASLFGIAAVVLAFSERVQLFLERQQRPR